jgi:nuclear pore complex protein Nup188
VFDLAYNAKDEELGQDMQLLVSVFEQCTKSELHSTPSMWLARCQEVDLIQSSLGLFVHTELIGYVDALGVRKPPLYAPHILQFHVTLSSSPESAIRLAHEGVMTAYTRNDLTAALESGSVDSVLADQPGERSSAHRSWCNILGVTSALIEVLSADDTLGRSGHFIEVEILGFVQRYGAQLTRVLGWAVEDPLTLPLLEEMGRVVKLFHVIAVAVSDTTDIQPGVADILQAFSDRTLQLLQRINYSITHPNQLINVLEPITLDERAQMEKEESGMAVDGVSQLADPGQKPLLASVVQTLLVLSRDIVLGLLIVSKADDIVVTPTSLGLQRYALLSPVS